MHRLRSSDGLALWREWRMTGLLRGVYAREYVDSRLTDWLWKRWIYTVKDYLKKKGLDIKEAKRMVLDRSL